MEIRVPGDIDPTLLFTICAGICLVLMLIYMMFNQPWGG